MAASNTNSIKDTANALFKDVFASEGVKDLVPEQFHIQRTFRWDNGGFEIAGKLFHQPILLTSEHGFTFAAPRAGNYNLRDAIPAQYGDLQIEPNQITGRLFVDLETLKRATSSKDSFGKVMPQYIANLTKSFRKKLEIQYLWGGIAAGSAGAGLGVISAVNGNILTILASEWAPGIWSGSTNMQVDVVDHTGVVRGTCTITKVDTANKKITVDAAPAGTTGGAIGTGDTLYFAGAYGNEMKGIFAILLNGTTSMLMNIDPAKFDLWAAPSTNMGGALSLSQGNVQNMISAAVDKGLDDDALFVCNHRGFKNMLTSEIANRRYDGGPGGYDPEKLRQGAKQLEFYEQNGMLTIVPHPFVKEGYCGLMSKTEWKRVGSTDITFDVGQGSDEFFHPLQDSNGLELRAYAGMAIYTNAPGRQGVGTGVVNT